MPLKGRDKLTKRLALTKDELNNQLVAVYAKGLSNIILASPVHFKDGGTFKNNWFLTVGNPSGKTRSGSKGGTGSFAEVGKLPSSVLGKTIYFTNNTPYANVIEYGGYPDPVSLGTNTGAGFQKLSTGGYSKQAPSGVVRVELVKMKKRIKRI